MKVTLVLVAIVAFVCAEELEKKSVASSTDVTRINSMLDSVKRISKQFTGAHIPSHLSTKAHDNIKKINEDFERIKHADEHTRKNLIEAVHLRLQALKQTKQEVSDLERSTKPVSHKASKPVSHKMSKPVSHKVSKPVSATKGHSATLRSAAQKDLEKIEASLKTANYGETKTASITSNINGMKKDLDEMSTANKDRRGRLMEALKLRMQALKTQMGPEEKQLEKQKPVSKEHSAVLKSEKDLEAVQKDVANTKGHAPLKKEITKNIAGMKTDLMELEAASSDRHNRLIEALKLRMKALKQQVTKLHTPEHPAHDEAEDLEAEHKTPAISSAHDVEMNLEAMTKDLHRLHDPQVSSNMREALKLRLKALNEQMKRI